MSQPSPLSTPEPWNLVCDGYVSELFEQFSAYAADALRLSELPAGADVVDVAAGPGSLSLLAAERAASVTAIDFAPTMLDELRRRAARAGLSNLTAVEGDGQNLPLDDACCDRAYSMFGVIFFPDRAAGLRELRRVLRPGGRAAVSSWAPFAAVPPLQAVFDCLRELMPELPFGTSKAPLSDPDEFRHELEQSGYEDVRIEVASHGMEATSTEAFWQSVCRSTAPIVLLRRNVGEERWSSLASGMLQKLTQRLGPGPFMVEPVAYIGVGTRA